MIRRIARPLLGSYFVYSGYQTLSNPAATAEASADVVAKAHEAFPDAPLPRSPATWARAIGGAQLVGGTLLAIGRAPRVSALALAATLAATTATENRFWTESDPQTREQATVDFVKNLSLIGGLVIAGFDTEGKPGLVWRSKRAGQQVIDAGQQAIDKATDTASNAVSALSPAAAGAGQPPNQFAEQLTQFQSRVHDTADKLGERIAHAKDVAADGAAQAAHRAAPVVANAADVAASAAEDLTESAAQKVADLRAQVLRPQ